MTIIILCNTFYKEKRYNVSLSSYNVTQLSWSNSAIYHRRRMQNLSLLTCHVTSTLRKFSRVQNTSARLITRTKKHNHITTVFVSLHWIPVQYRIQYKLLLYTLKVLNGLAPIYLAELINIYQPTRSLRSEYEIRLIQPRVRTKQ